MYIKQTSSNSSVTIWLFLFLLLFYSAKPVAQEISSEQFFPVNTKAPGYNAKKKKNTDLFQGNKKDKNYFEGWYFKMVAKDGSSILSVIPGVSFSENGQEQHAFIQLIDGRSAETYYFKYSIDSFSYSKDRFAVKIGKNFFSTDSLILCIKSEGMDIQGKVKMTNRIQLKTDGKKKDKIMGWYGAVPFMQCYHGVVSLSHDLSGLIELNKNCFDFNNGKGYIEKDWGRSMPSAWIWMQSNSFGNSNTSFMLSVANIPWLGSEFTGFLGFFMHNDSIKRFATYTKAELKLEDLKTDTLKISITDKDFTYKIKAVKNNSGLLKAPVKGAMDRRIAESVDAKLNLQVMDKQGNILLEDSTNIAGLEIVGDINQLKPKIK